MTAKTRTLAIYIAALLAIAYGATGIALTAGEVSRKMQECKALEIEACAIQPIGGTK